MSDTIYRDEAIKEIKAEAFLGIVECQEGWLIDRIKAIPSADRPKGEWICHEGGWKDFDYYPTKYECNQCHHYVDVASDKNFCPNCGADMRKGADDE